MHKINNLYSLFRPRTLLLILGMGVAFIVVVLLLVLPDIHKVTEKAR
jgi:Na+-transporting methylmalonyl-CoA/oxaloacetate decarboxylase gamma subunit